MDFDKIDLDEMTLKDPLVSTYTATISTHIGERLERHILILKKLVDRSTTKQRWIIQAIQDKLANDTNKQEPPRSLTINVKIAKELDKEVMQRVEFIKKFKGYSKKQWLIDAILEKLDRDRKEIEKKYDDQAYRYKQQIEELKAENAMLKTKLN